MTLSQERLATIVFSLAKRPGHETVRVLINELCTAGLGVEQSEILFEVPIPEVRGRADSLLGSTIFEFKRDLRAERSEAEAQLVRYISEKERSSGNRYLGIATDGAEFIAYQLSGNALREMSKVIALPTDPRALLQWLDTATSVRGDLLPEPAIVRSELGRDGLVYRRAIEALNDLWQDAQNIPEAQLKRDLWAEHLEFVYGVLVEPETLFLQHTYLTIVAKTMAVQVLSDGATTAGELLQGAPFTRVGLHGAVETDFFDWVLLVANGAELVERVARQVARFRLNEVNADVLKALYESLIDPEQRHYLGEYYTPDWLAEWMLDEVVPNPLSTTIFDPSCGSGTFLFKSVRRFLDAAKAQALEPQTALAQCVEHVVGLDVHPVAVLFARVTYLLAIGPEWLSQRTDDLFVPVYLGDALQWNVRQFLSDEEVEVYVPQEKPLRFPGTVAGDPHLLESVLITIKELADQNAPANTMRRWLRLHTPLSDSDAKILVETYDQMRALHAAGRNHIWTYIVRNLTRPLWLSLKDKRADVVVGNPPWLRYNAMSPALRQRFQAASKERNLWVGGKVASHQDLCAYFFARCCERYLSKGGRIAFVMPHATLSRKQYEQFRTGRFVSDAGVGAMVEFATPWAFGSDVAPLFPVPSAVLFATRSKEATALPTEEKDYFGSLPSRDATSSEAKIHLLEKPKRADVSISTTALSPYGKEFRQGATVVPRRLFLVSRPESGSLGQSLRSPNVQSRVSSQDKSPWKEMAPLCGQVESLFLRPLWLGESIAPFRLLRPAEAIIPWSEEHQGLLDSKSALSAGHVHLARWLGNAESKWSTLGTGRMSLSDRVDFYGNLSCQFPLPDLRVVYTKAGTKAAAALLNKNDAVIDHKLYWMPTDSMAEGDYLCAILNSDTTRSRITHLQSTGAFGPRDFDKVMFRLPIPKFDASVDLHILLSDAGKRAREIASGLSLAHPQKFQSARKAIRKHLDREGVSKEVDRLVDALLLTTCCR